MPQKLSNAWMKELGEKWEQIHNNYINNIGNLTLAAYNEKYSNRTFLEKRDLVNDGHPIGLGNCPLRLNEGLSRKDQWGKTEIVERTEKLAEEATMVWPYPQLSPEIIAKYRLLKTEEYNVDDSEDSKPDDEYY
ncbi:Uncharacterised protein [uncultured archaeon]|nr:Uncharacterised protein [uncultured archaeon]